MFFQIYNLARYINDIEQLPNIEPNIMELSDRLTKIQNSMQ